jgi:hypothetical protein
MKQELKKSESMNKERLTAITTARNLLEARVTEPEQICRAITQLGKPYDAQVIEEHASLVSTYLDDPDHVVRYQAIWFLGSWGHLSTFAEQILVAARTDPDTSNRAFAVQSVGSVLKHVKDPLLTKQLVEFVDDQKEDLEVRLSAYSGLLYAWNRPDAFVAAITNRPKSSIDRDFVEQLHLWIRNEQQMPLVTPPEGIFKSLIHAWQSGLLADLIKIRFRKEQQNGN